MGDYVLLTNTAFLTPFSVRNLIGDGKLPKIMIEVKLIRNQNSDSFHRQWLTSVVF